LLDFRSSAIATDGASPEIVAIGSGYTRTRLGGSGAVAAVSEQCNLSWSRRFSLFEQGRWQKQKI
jgi:hypothetical protein